MNVMLKVLVTTTFFYVALMCAKETIRTLLWEKVANWPNFWPEIAYDMVPLLGATVLSILVIRE